MTVACFTALTFGDLPRARVLAETLRAAHPDWARWAVLIDRAPPGLFSRHVFDAFDAVVPIEQLGIPDLPGWLFQRDAAEARAAARGPMARHLLGLGADLVVSLGIDDAVFHPIAPLGDASVLALARQGDGRPDVLAARGDAAGRAFAAAWAERPDTPPFGMVARGGLAVARDPGWTATSSRLAGRGLRFTPSGAIEIGGAPLSLCRFDSPPEPDTPADADSAPMELWRWHARAAAARAEPGVPVGWWHYGSFSDGAPIPPAARRLARERPDVLARFADPFEVAGASFRAWLARHAPLLSREPD